jgi:catechol 2,3-dioxygenase-like lactoylglutathione lyase family enzyme
MKFNKLIPELSVSNLEKSIKFYTQIGFKVEYERKKSKFVFLSLQGSQIMLEETNDHWKTGELKYPFGRGINFQISVQDIQPILTCLKKIKYTLKVKPKTNTYRKGKEILTCREFLVMDPDGYLLRFTQDLEK